jgi:23S rRNA pseudouridine955/2504/2580 synthase
MSDTEFNKVQFITVDADFEGQRVDNYLKNILKGVPKSMIYRIIRKGEVRVNKGRVKPEYKLKGGDYLRVPPVRVSEPNELPSTNLSKVASLESHILYEDDVLIVLNKPSGMAVHGGSGLSFGVIESLRALRPQQKFLELVHRLDRATSGCLLIAKKRSALKHIHEQLRLKTVDKRYQALVHGIWAQNRFKVKAPLQKNVLKSGERMVFVNPEGKPSETKYRILNQYEDATLVEASPVTGRTHQIRVHCQHAGHSIALDDKYGEQAFDARMKSLGLNRLFLHAHSIRFIHPKTSEQVRYEAPLDSQLTSVLEKLS